MPSPGMPGTGLSCSRSFGVYAVLRCDGLPSLSVNRFAFSGRERRARCSLRSKAGPADCGNSGVSSFPMLHPTVRRQPQGPLCPSGVCCAYACRKSIAWAAFARSIDPMPRMAAATKRSFLMIAKMFMLSAFSKQKGASANTGAKAAAPAAAAAGGNPRSPVSSKSLAVGAVQASWSSSCYCSVGWELQRERAT
jgi:hypothetical protein